MDFFGFNSRPWTRQIISVEKGQIPDRSTQKAINRGLIALQTNYLSRETSLPREKAWELDPYGDVHNWEADSVEYISWVGNKSVNASEIMEPFRLDSELSPRGLGYPLLRVVSKLFSFADHLEEQVVSEIYAHSVIWYGLPLLQEYFNAIPINAIPIDVNTRTDNANLTYSGSDRLALNDSFHFMALIGRLFVQPKLTRKEHLEFYQNIALRLKEKKIRIAFIEVTDRAHVKLYSTRLGFRTAFTLRNPKYGEDDTTIMFIRVEELLRNVALD